MQKKETHSAFKHDALVHTVHTVHFVHNVHQPETSPEVRPVKFPQQTAKFGGAAAK